MTDYRGDLRSRRSFVKSGCLAAAAALWTGCRSTPHQLFTPPPVNAGEEPSIAVNDIHSQLNATSVRQMLTPASVDECRDVILKARSSGRPLCIAGGRHAMGGQQFVSEGVLIDIRAMNKVLHFDADKGLITVESGIEWPELIGYLHQVQESRERQWAIVQKQTGADKFTLGGSLSANVHGRALDQPPIVGNVESFTILNDAGDNLRCDRGSNPELFRLAIGGYGLFGLITSVTLRLRERVKVQRIVELRDTRDIPEAMEKRIADGYLYGDYQFATDSGRDSFLRRGVFSCYRPMPMSVPVTDHPVRFSAEDWARLTYYTHKYKQRAFELYSKRYLETSGQIYWSDSQLFGSYLDNNHQELDRKLHARTPATEMITEIDVPRSSLVDFMEEARRALRQEGANVIYGVVRLIEKDTESFLPWAKGRFACVVFNLHVTHNASGIENAARSFRSLIDLAIRHHGSYYLTYHRFATRDQVERCYPEFRRFLELKHQYDAGDLFQSNWYHHQKGLFAE